MFKQKRNPFVFLSLFLPVLASLNACNKNQPLTPRLSPLITSIKESVRIGEVTPLSGLDAGFGVSSHRGVELAVRQINESGGINGKKIKLIKVDDGGLPGEATWRANTLVNEMVLGVIGHLNSDTSISASEIYSMAMIAEISPGSTKPLFTERDKVHGYVFRTVGRDDQQGKTAA